MFYTAKLNLTHHKVEFVVKEQKEVQSISKPKVKGQSNTTVMSIFDDEYQEFSQDFEIGVQNSTFTHSV